MTISRRQFVCVAVPAVIAASSFPANRLLAAQGSSGITYPILPDVIAAGMVAATRTQDVRNEPLGFVFISYEFPSEAKAEASFDTVTEHNEKVATADLDSYRQISLGKIGDQRWALYNDDKVHPWSLRAVVRMDAVILEYTAIGTAGPLDAFSADFLETFLASRHTWDVNTIIPTIDDLPVGFMRVPETGVIDILDDVLDSE